MSISMAEMQREVAELRRPFKVALLAVAITFVLVGGLIAAFGTGADRPEGAAERWLSDVSDTTRKGVLNDARQRVADDGDPAIAQAIIGEHADKDEKTTFTAIEVGHARRSEPNSAQVPILVSYRAEGAGNYEATLVLNKIDDRWRVVALLPLDATLRVPSEGGGSVANATFGLYAGAVVVGGFVTLGASLLVRKAGSHRLHNAAATSV